MLFSKVLRVYFARRYNLDKMKKCHLLPSSWRKSKNVYLLLDETVKTCKMSDPEMIGMGGLNSTRLRIVEGWKNSRKLHEDRKKEETRNHLPAEVDWSRRKKHEGECCVFCVACRGWWQREAVKTDLIVPEEPYGLYNTVWKRPWTLCKRKNVVCYIAETIAHPRPTSLLSFHCASLTSPLFDVSILFSRSSCFRRPFVTEGGTILHEEKFQENSFLVSCWNVVRKIGRSRMESVFFVCKRQRRLSR